MKKLRIHIANNRLLYRMIAIFSLLSVAIIVALTSVMYLLFSENIKNEIYRSQEQSLKQVANTVSFRAEYANSLMVQVKLNRDSSKLFFYTDSDSVSKGLDKMNEIRSSVKQLHSVYLYNEEADRIYYSGDNTMETVSSMENFADQGFVEVLNHIAQYPKYTPFLRKISITSPSGREFQTYVYTYLLYDTYQSGNVKNIVALNFYTGWMKDALDFISIGQDTMEGIWIADRKRQIVYNNTGDLIGTIGDRELLPDAIYEEESGYKIIGKGRDRKMLVYATPDIMGYDNWTFVARTDYAALMEPLEKTRSIIYAVCAAAFVLSLLVIGGLSHVIYQPILHTLNRMKLLETEQVKKRKTDRILFLRKLFQGNIADDINVIGENFRQHQIEADLEADIRMVLIAVDYLSSYRRKYRDCLEETEETVEKIIRQQFGYEEMLCVKMQNGVWAVCLPAEKDIDIQDVFKRLNERLLEKVEITVSMTFSSVGHSVRDVPYLYSEVVNTLSYRFLWGQNKLITAEDVEKQGLLRFEYCHDVEKKLLGFLFSAKYEETMEAYEEFTEAIRWYSVEEIRLSFMLLACAVKNASVKTMAETSSVLLEFDAFYKKIQSVETIEEVHQMFKNLFREITDKLQVHAKERHEALIEDIKVYVKENYGDINLSMNQVSDYVNMSAAYLGRLFKKVTGTAFAEYLTKYRLNKACCLLRESTMTINEISDAVGFTNSSYFYIIFKKNLDCTPNQYRRQYVKADDKNVTDDEISDGTEDEIIEE